MIRGFQILLAVLMLPALLHAQQIDTTLDLNGAIRLGLNNSKQLKLSSAKVEQAIADVDNMKNNRLPGITLSGAYYYMSNPTLNISPSLLGGAGGSSSSSGSSGAGFAMPSIHQAVYGMAMANEPLFAGGKIQNGIKSAQYLADAAKLDVKNDKEQVIQNTIEAYCNLYKAEATVRLVRENLEMEKQRVIDFTNMENNGIVARNDLLKVELQESNVELSLLDAENNRSVANYNFNIMLGLNDSMYIHVDTNNIVHEPELPNLSDLDTMAHSNRFDYLAILDRQQAAAYNTKVVKGNMYPAITLSGGYVAADIPKAFSLYNEVNVGLGLSYDIGSLYKNGAKVRQAQAEEKILEATKENLDDNIRMQIFQAYNNYSESLKKIEVYKVAIVQAEENYRVTKNKYDNALETTTDLLDADVALLQARINYEYARADATVSYNKIFETVGTLNKQYNSIH